MCKSVANAWALTFALLPWLVHAILATGALSWSAAPVVLDVVILAMAGHSGNSDIWAGLFRVVRVPWSDTRITCNNFGYCGLEPELVFGFFGLGFFGFGLGFFRYGFRVFCPPISKTGYQLFRGVEDHPENSQNFAYMCIHQSLLVHRCLHILVAIFVLLLYCYFCITIVLCSTYMYTKGSYVQTPVH